MTRFVLVHGACHGAWCWERLAPALSGRGHSAVAIDLPGHRDPAVERGMRRTLGDGVAAVVAALEGEREQTILVGHSLGGMTISAVAEAVPDKVGMLVYVTALLPLDGEAASDLSLTLGLNSAGASFVLDDGCRIATDPTRARPYFYGDCSGGDADWAIKQLTPTDMNYITSPVHLSAARFGRVRKTYVQCLRDRAIPISAQRAMIARYPGIAVRTLDADHSPFLAMPGVLADLLVAV